MCCATFAADPRSLLSANLPSDHIVRVFDWLVGKAEAMTGLTVTERFMILKFIRYFRR